ncbi:MAG: TRAP transporter substrate-binding protein [Fusobacteriaceae bacterium]|jgi:tripartite ATP-independent transporter DctP family solute receptor|nr:TRAP transporter substrate-binding protein [Fusobacteriaceae bacterium]
MKQIKGNICKLLVMILVMLSIVSYGAEKSAKKPSVVITLATGMSEDHAANIAFKKFIKTIEEKSNGEMTGILYPNNQLGGDVVAMQGTQDGSIVMCWSTTANQVSLIPELAIFDIPFMYDNLEHAIKAMNNEEFLNKIQEKFNAAGLHCAGVTPTGFRWLSANKEIHKLEDLKGLKIRTMENAYHIAAWKALGVTPTPLANSERYAALQQGTVDGQENAMENAYSTKMYEVQKVFINTQHICYLSSWAMNKDFYDKLSPEHKAIFDEAMEICVKEAQKATIENEEQLLKSLESMGKTVIRSLDPGENDRWRKIAQPAAEDLVRKNIGNEMIDILHKAVGK